MEESPPFLIHCSSLLRWAQCEKSALESLFNPRPVEDRPEHVATWIGSAVHARLADDSDPEFPQAVRFDGITPGRKEAEAQVSAMSAAVRHLMEEIKHGIFVEHERELPPFREPHWPVNIHVVGTCDLLYDEDTGIVLADLKTSREMHPAWLQLGAYAALMAAGGMSMPDRLAVLHCPRPARALDEASVQVLYNDVDACMAEARRVMNRVAHIVGHPLESVAAPGGRCRFCDHPSCVMRARDFMPR